MSPMPSPSMSPRPATAPPKLPCADGAGSSIGRRFTPPAARLMACETNTMPSTRPLSLGAGLIESMVVLPGGSEAGAQVPGPPSREIPVRGPEAAERELDLEEDDLPLDPDVVQPRGPHVRCLDPGSHGGTE